MEQRTQEEWQEREKELLSIIAYFFNCFSIFGMALDKIHEVVMWIPGTAMSLNVTPEMSVEYRKLLEQKYGFKTVKFDTGKADESENKADAE